MSESETNPIETNLAYLQVQAGLIYEKIHGNRGSLSVGFNLFGGKYQLSNGQDDGGS